MPLAAGAVEAQVVPFEVNTLPVVPGATTCKAEPLLPNKTLFTANVVEPVPPLPTGSVPVTPVVNGRPVRLVATPDVGVPNKGVIKVGLVALTTVPVPVPVYSELVK